jgi:hypothetical protein
MNTKLGYTCQIRDAAPHADGYYAFMEEIMEVNEWKAKNKGRRNYAHFDNKVSLEDVWSYIKNPKYIESHSFYPFIHYTHKSIKYNKDEGIKTKKRKICYSAHIDRLIFQFYGYKLNQLYNLRVKNDGIDDSVIAYRDNLGKNNVHFAKKAIDFIREKESCFIIVGDFTNFFDSLEHKYLKNMLKKLLQTNELPADYYAVYKNITRFSTWDIEILLELNGLNDDINGIEKLNDLDRVLTPKQFKDNKKKYIKPHNKIFGIPQGSSISAILSNIYMLEFDKKLNDYVNSLNGLYMRYSDDFIIVLPQDNTDVFKEQFNYINSLIKFVPRLDLQPDKTQVFNFENKILTSFNELVLEGIKNNRGLLNYLGFTFDGNVATIRDRTLSKYYYRMYRKLKTITKNNGRTKDGNRISCKNIYEKYSIKGAQIKKVDNINNRNNAKKGNFISYVKRSEAIFGKNEAINRGTKNHMQKIRKKLDLIK